ncbi:MAG: zf-HC2 domain-containing protein [Lachnospiraceae bacterium]|jgi:hypothetical protein|nr:zf-HC2 domain-containing protein [Lachnospiraceae bacterium]
MDCKQFEKMIPDFLADRLDGAQTDEFLKHFNTCVECHEELSIQYLVYAGLPKLETGETFNLGKDLQNEINCSIRRKRRRRHLSLAAAFLEICALGCAAAVAASIFFLFFAKTV